MGTLKKLVVLGLTLLVACSAPSPRYEDAQGTGSDANVAIDAQVGVDGAPIPDAGIDGPVPDAAVIDAAVVDAAVPDAAVPDAAIPDAAIPDAAIPDASIPDANIPDGPPPDAAGPIAPTWTLLSETGLYSDISTYTVDSEAREFDPAYHLWSDNAAKTRWIYLPAGTQIDTSDMDAWEFPVGTKVWKEFVDDSQIPPVRLETRLIYVWGPGPDDIWMGSFIWNAMATDAVYADAGGTNVNGTQHDVPPSWECVSCHGGNIDRLLGFSAVMLSTTNTLNLTSLASDGWLTNPPPVGTQYPVPGNAVESEALGYLHANCGHCHGEQPDLLSCGDITSLRLRVFSTDTDVQTTGAYVTAVDVMINGAGGWTAPLGMTMRVAPGDATNSALHFRMTERGNSDMMPPDFTEVVDAIGVQIIADWINAMPAP